MVVDPQARTDPYALGRDEGEARWFLDFLVTLKATAETTGGRLALIEHRAAKGAGSPLHVHHREAECFYVLEGELTVWTGGRLLQAPAWSFVYGPPDVPHTFVVVSQEARFLVLTQPAGFEGFVRAFSEPTPGPTLPPPPSRPPDVDRLTTLAAEHGIEVLEPPGIPTGAN